MYINTVCDTSVAYLFHVHDIFAQILVVLDQIKNKLYVLFVQLILVWQGEIWINV